MKELKELGLKPKDLLKVKNWLNGWMQHFTRMAEGNRETVERYDLEKLDFFYFTDCRDILSKNPESKGVEDAASIRRRKRAVEYRLLFRKLLGEELGRKRPCSHCGNDDRWINSLGDGTGHYVYCPKCKMTVIVTYPIGYPTCIDRVKEDINKHGLDGVPGKICPICKEVYHYHGCTACGYEEKKTTSCPKCGEEVYIGITGTWCKACDWAEVEVN